VITIVQSTAIVAGSGIEARTVQVQVGAAGNAGFDIYVDTTIKTVHICMMGVDEALCKLNHAMMEHGRQIDFIGGEN